MFHSVRYANADTETNNPSLIMPDTVGGFETRSETIVPLGACGSWASRVKRCNGTAHGK
jgi:hypothetical protein